MIITHLDNHAWPHANCEVQLLCAFVKTDVKRWSVSIRNAPSKLFESLWKFCERSLKFRWPSNDSPITRFVHGFERVDTIWMNIKKKTDTCMQKLWINKGDWWCAIDFAFLFSLLLCYWILLHNNLLVNNNWSVTLFKFYN